MKIHLTLGVLGFICGANLLSASETKPNIIVILADDLGYGSLECYGGKGLATPNCDRLVREGRRYTNAYAAASVCSPSRYSIMTGRYLWRTRYSDGVGLGEADPLVIETTGSRWARWRRVRATTRRRSANGTWAWAWPRKQTGMLHCCQGLCRWASTISLAWRRT